MMTSTDQNMMCTVMSEIANLRSSGLLDGFLSMYGAKIRQDQPDAGERHAGDHRVEHREQFLQTEEVPRRLRRVRRAVGVGLLQQRRVDPHREEEGERSARQRGDELGREQVRPGVHLVDRRRLDVLDGAALDDRQQPLGVTARTGTHGHTACGRAGRHDAGDALLHRDGAPPPESPPSEPSVFAFAALLRSSRCAGMRGIGGGLGGVRAGCGCRRGGSRAAASASAFSAPAGPLEKMLRYFSH